MPACADCRPEPAPASDACRRAPATAAADAVTWSRAGHPLNTRPEPNRGKASPVVIWLALLAWLLLNAAPVVSQCLYHVDPAQSFPGWCDGHDGSTPAQPGSLPADDHADEADAGKLCGYCDLLFHSPLQIVDFLIAALLIGTALPRLRRECWEAPPHPESQHIQVRGPPRLSMP